MLKAELVSTNIAQGSFQVGLFDCCHSGCACFVSFCVPCGPCCLQAIAVDKATHSGTIGPFCLDIWCLCFGFAYNRRKIRERYGIPGSKCEDCVLSWRYGHCTSMQEYNDAKLRNPQ